MASREALGACTSEAVRWCEGGGAGKEGWRLTWLGDGECDRVERDARNGVNGEGVGVYGYVSMCVELVEEGETRYERREEE
jgi:hypothetical protein